MTHALTPNGDPRLPDDGGSEPLSGPSDARLEADDPCSSPPPVREGAAPESEGPPELPPGTDVPGRPHDLPLLDEAGLGALLSRAGIDPGTALPRLSRPQDLRKVLEDLGPVMAASQVSAINRFWAIADRAQDNDNDVLNMLATDKVAKYQHKLIELVLGRTVNLHASVKSQRDLPKLDKLPPQKRAQLEALIEEVSGEIVEADFEETRSD